VRPALKEREVLWRIAQHRLAAAVRAAAPEGLRPAWLLRLGLFIHDHLGMPLRDVSRIGFEFSDCRGQGNRLVVLNAREAQMRGILHFGYCLRSWPAIAHPPSRHFDRYRRFVISSALSERRPF
jgi:glycerol-3-phosphate dehydrogenase